MFDIEGPLSGAVSCLSIEAPVETWYRRQIMAALALMTNHQNWNIQPGAVSPALVLDAASAAAGVLGSYQDSCEGGSAGLIGSLVIVLVETVLPDNLLPCDGAVHNRVDYPLFYDYLAANASPLVLDADTFQTLDLAATSVFVNGFGTIPAFWCWVAK